MKHKVTVKYNPAWAPNFYEASCNHGDWRRRYRGEAAAEDFAARHEDNANGLVEAWVREQEELFDDRAPCCVCPLDDKGLIDHHDHCGQGAA